MQEKITELEPMDRGVVTPIDSKEETELSSYSNQDQKPYFEGEPEQDQEPYIEDESEQGQETCFEGESGEDQKSYIEDESEQGQESYFEGRSEQDRESYFEGEPEQGREFYFESEPEQGREFYIEGETEQDQEPYFESEPKSYSDGEPMSFLPRISKEAEDLYSLQGSVVLDRRTSYVNGMALQIEYIVMSGHRPCYVVKGNLFSQRVRQLGLLPLHFRLKRAMRKVYKCAGLVEKGIQS